MRLLALDYGERYVGTAITDELGVIAYPLESIQRKEANKLRKTYARIEEIVKEYNIEKIIVGLPLNMDDTESRMAESAKKFASDVERRTGIPVIMWDERLSTYTADDILKETGVNYKDRKRYVDKLAACFILESYMESE